MKFTEAQLEKTFAELLAQQGYAHQPGGFALRNL